MISQNEIGVCLRFFNVGGYVLDFSTNDFDNFTRSIIGESLCSKYGVSKGKSLTKYTTEAKIDDVLKLFIALLEHYEYSREYEADKEKDNEHYHDYIKCKKIVDKYHPDTFESKTAIQIKEEFSSDYIKSQIDLMLQMANEQPTDAIGKAKELVESCCKTILGKEGIIIDSKWDIINLVDETFKLFNIMPKNIPDNTKGAGSIKKILGSLKAVVQGMTELRNMYGSGHGKDDSYIGLEPRHANLAVGCSITIVRFLWDSYERYQKNKQTAA